MPRISVPPTADPMMHVWAGLAPQLTRPAAAYSGAVYASETFSLREMEAMRITVAVINDCTICLGWRSGRDVASRAEQAAEIDEAFYAAVIGRDLGGLSARERLCATFAEKFCVDHTNMDDALWTELHDHFTDDELVELALSVGAWLATGRFNRVFDIDGGCRVDLPG